MASPARQTIERLMRAQRRRCYLCARECRAFELGMEASGTFPTIDHIVPRAAGGWRSPPNVALACATCNRRKQDRAPTACERLFGEVVAEMAWSARRSVRRWRTQWQRTRAAATWENPALAEALKAAAAARS